MRESEMVEDVNDSLRMHCNPISRPWSPIPNSLDIVVKLLTVTMTEDGADDLSAAGAARADRPSLFARGDAVIPLVVNIAPVVVDEEALQAAGDGVVKRFVATQKQD